MVLVFMWLPRMSDESLQTRKQEVKAASEFMVKAHSLAAESWVTKSFAAERLIRDFECDLVEHVFEKFSDDNKKLTMAEHVVVFVRKLSGHESALSASTSSTSESRNDTMFDATADEAVHRVLEKTGNTPGFILFRIRQKPSARESQFKVNHVNDSGSFGIRAINLDGSLCESVTIVLMNKIPDYTNIKKEHRLRLNIMPQPI
jgi:hypothetical protein